MNWDGKVLFDSNGRMVRCEYSWERRKYYYDYLIPFYATLTIKGTKGSLYLLNDNTKEKYPLFDGDLLAIAVTVGIKPGGIITAMWEACKRGKAYGIRPIEVKDWKPIIEPGEYDIEL
ncbi:MAG: hypothetical protein WC449_04705 [Candidatus Paceibacterota bacterium]